MISNNSSEFDKIKLIDLKENLNINKKQIDYIIKHEIIDFKIYGNSFQKSYNAISYLKDNFSDTLCSPEFVNNYLGNFVDKELANTLCSMSNFAFPFNSNILSEVFENIDAVLSLKEKEEDINYNEFFLVIMNLLTVIDDNAANYDYNDLSKSLAVLYSIYKFKDNKAALKKHITDICNRNAYSYNGRSNKILVQYRIILLMTALFYHINLPQDTLFKLFNFVSLSQKSARFSLYKNAELVRRICDGLIKQLYKLIKLINKADHNSNDNGSSLINQAAAFVDSLLSYYDENNCFSELAISKKITTLIVLVIFYARISEDSLVNSFSCLISELLNELDKDLSEHRFDGLFKMNLKSAQVKQVISSIQDEHTIVHKLMNNDSIERLIRRVYKHKSFIILLLIMPHIISDNWVKTRYMYSKNKLLYALASLRSFNGVSEDELIKIFSGIEYSDCITKYNQVIKDDSTIDYYFNDCELPDELINEYYDSMKVIPELNKLLVELNKLMEAEINGTKYRN